MAAVLTLSEALNQGGMVVWEPPDRPRLRVARRWVEAIQRDEVEIREVLRRAVLFRKQLEAAASGVVTPYFLLPECGEVRSGQCISCGEELPEPKNAVRRPRVRCLPCIAALYLAFDQPQRLAGIMGA
jgi:hypothetical protein